MENLRWVLLKRYPVVYAAAGTSYTAVPVTYSQLLELGGKPCDFCEVRESS